MFRSGGTHKGQKSSKVDVPTLFLKGSEANGVAIHIRDRSTDEDTTTIYRELTDGP